MKILNDSDVMKISPGEAVGVMERVFREKSDGYFFSPPRMHLDSPDGKIVFTPGGSLRGRIMGFRVYTTFGGDQITMVYDSRNGKLKGAVMGDYLGALRTGSIGSVSTRYMSNPDSGVLGIIGTGSQAFTQTLTSASVRNFREIHVYSRDDQHRRMFADKIGKMTGIKTVTEESSGSVARLSDVLVLATTSHSPVVKSSDIKPGTHVITVGRKSVDEHELDYEIAENAEVIATDSPVQLDSYDPPHFLSGTNLKKHIVDLSDIVSGKIPGRKARDAITLFLSVGLSGTEVALADYLLDRSESM